MPPAVAGFRPGSVVLALLASLCLLLAPAPAALAVAAQDLPELPLQDHVIDTSAVLSRAASAELEKRLQALEQDHIDARLVTVPRLDYGLTLPELGRQLIDRWQAAAAPDPLLLLLIDSQNNSGAVVAAPALEGQLPAELLESTARATMSAPLREGARYRQASLAALDRLDAVLQGGEDPGEPAEAEVVSVPSNVPSREETASSNAFTWVVVLLVVGTIVPMLTWWVFSR
ncbi:MAG: TPM domain-containing protein [Synechococcus sp.]|nr:TPM domain-containing protein [Synechococcus sp.]